MCTATNSMLNNSASHNAVNNVLNIAIFGSVLAVFLRTVDSVYLYNKIVTTCLSVDKNEYVYIC